MLAAAVGLWMLEQPLIRCLSLEMAPRGQHVAVCSYSSLGLPRSWIPAAGCRVSRREQGNPLLRLSMTAALKTAMGREDVLSAVSNPAWIPSVVPGGGLGSPD